MLTLPLTLLTAFIGASYDKIDNFISFLGGFCSTTVSFFFPAFIYIVSNKLPLRHPKSVVVILIFGIMSLIGIASGTKSFIQFILG